MDATPKIIPIPDEAWPVWVIQRLVRENGRIKGRVFLKKTSKGIEWVAKPEATGYATWQSCREDIAKYKNSRDIYNAVHSWHYELKESKMGNVTNNNL